jgi:CubicO group peptidase (beta-lactamase class C family)
MNRQATLANWRTTPHNRWAFHHVRELIPSADIPNDPDRVRPLPAAPLDFSAFRLEPDSGAAAPSFEALLEDTGTDGMAILHRGRLLFERYANGMTRETPHILMSVSKSMLGLLFGRLGLEPERKVADVLPELSSTAYRGATLRDLLDMRAGIAFDEDYLATRGPIVEYRKSTGWNPLAPGEAPSDLHSFYRKLEKSDGTHGGRFHYVSPNTDLLGWVIERATGRRYADLLSELVWKPIGAERSAYITVDRLGAPRAAGGMCATLRDLARAGQWLIEEPSTWFDDIERNGERKAWEAGSFVEYWPGLAMHYRSQWYVVHADRQTDGAAPLAFGYGIHGQHLFVDRVNELVVAKLSSQTLPIDPARIALTMRFFWQLRKSLR